MTVLLAHLLKRQFQPERRGASWEITIRNQREAIPEALQDTPSLKPMLSDATWLKRVFRDARQQAAQETGLGGFPETCPWTIEPALDVHFFPLPAQES